jgi:hypothetical protein
VITAPQPVVSGMLTEMTFFVHIAECVAALSFVTR